MEDITYTLARVAPSPTLVKSFVAMSDSFGDKVKANFLNACGKINYVIRDTISGTIKTFVQITDDANDSTKKAL